MARPAAPRGQGRVRVVDAALELFARHGVSGTSLQDIADHLGVTKAAVYYQFHSKEEIVLAVVDSAFADIRGFLGDAEAQPTPAAVTDATLVGLVDVIVAHRQAIVLMTDPEAARLLEAHEEFGDLVERLGDALEGPDPSVARRVAVAVVAPGMAQAGLDPRLADVDDGTLRSELLALARQVLG